MLKDCEESWVLTAATRVHDALGPGLLESVYEKALVELKCVESFADLHIAQMITYLHLLGYKRGYLLNFNTRLLKYGIKRVSI